MSGAARERSLLHAGLNTGSVIIRNSDWSRMLVEDMATYGKYPVDWAKEATLRAAVPTYDMGMYEQNVLIYRLTSDPSMMQRVRSPALSHSIVCAASHACDMCMLEPSMTIATPSFHVQCDEADEAC